MAETYESKVQKDTGVYTAVILDGRGRTIEEAIFSTLDEATAFSTSRLRWYQSPIGGPLASVARVRIALRRLKAAAARARIKSRYNRDEVI